MKMDKTVLVVDDSEIDRTILVAMLRDDFNVIEKTSGFMAIDYLTNQGKPDVLLLDVSMPSLDGFDVLQFMREAEIDDVPVFLVTAEATRDNVERAAQYGVVEFIRKPFEKDDIIRRIKMQLGIFSEGPLTREEVHETDRYITELEAVYKRYLKNYGQDLEHYQRVSDLMKIMLTNQASSSEGHVIDREHIEIISKAGFFCDLGNMVVPPETVKIMSARSAERDSYQYHTVLGAKLINLNQSEKCRYFIEVCSTICMHHHERADSKGRNPIYSQLCRLAEQFDHAFIRYKERGERQFEFVVEDLRKDEGNVNEEVLSMLEYSKWEILRYYQRTDKLPETLYE